MKSTEIYLQSITNVDYTHFLDKYRGKCAALHSHSSYFVNLYVRGKVVNDMVVDYKIIKQVVKSAIDLIDHKILIGTDVGFKVVGDATHISYVAENGYHFFNIPSCEVYVMKSGRPTLENICKELGEVVLKNLPENVDGVGFEMREGINNGAIVWIYREETGETYLK
ncbi:MAG: 6-carboxytetrahydropterin synthase [Clostridia bacterium]|jgi:6-pyruvoyl-tetrahydropterin synthase